MSILNDQNLIKYLQKDNVEIEWVEVQNETKEITTEETGREFFATGRRTLYVEIFDKNLGEKEMFE